MTPEDILTEPLLERIRGRAAGYDRDNAFFHEDLAELAAAGLPEDLRAGVRRRPGARARGGGAAAAAAGDGGPGHRAGDQHAPGVDRRRARPRRPGATPRWTSSSRRPRRGRFLPSGIRRRATTPCCSTPAPRRVPQPDGSYAFTGRKIFTSLSPAWTRLGIFGKDSAGPGRRGGAGARLHHPGHPRLRDPAGLGHPGHAGQPVQHHGAGRRRRPGRTGSSGNCRWARTRTR